MLINLKQMSTKYIQFCINGDLAMLTCLFAIVIIGRVVAYLKSMVEHKTLWAISNVEHAGRRVALHISVGIIGIRVKIDTTTNVSNIADISDLKRKKRGHV